MTGDSPTHENPGPATNHRTLIRKSLAILAFFAAAAYLYLSHLSGATPFNGDENRVYHFTYFAPLKYFICSPFTHLFQSQDAPYYVMAVFGLANTSLMFVLVRLLYPARYAWAAAVFYLLYDFPLGFAKVLYYSSIITCFVLCSIILFILAVRRRSWLLLFLAGSMPGLMVTTHISSYAPAGALVCLFVYWAWREIPCRQFSPLTVLLVCACGGAAAFGCVEAYIYARYAHQPGMDYTPYISSLFSYRIQMDDFIGTNNGPAGVLKIFSRTWHWARLHPVDPGQLFRTAVIYSVSIAAASLIIRKKDERGRGLVFFLALGLGTYLLNTALNFHVVQPRMLTWISVPVSFLAGWLVIGIWERRSTRTGKILLAVAALYLLSASGKCLAITRSVPSVNEMRAYFREHGIKNSEITTFYHSLNDYKDYRSGNKTQYVPAIECKDERLRNEQIFFHIHWPMIYKLYKSGKIKYYLSSGILDLAYVGKYDPFLKDIKPIMKWGNHPNLNTHFYREAPREIPPIKLYRLDDIFSDPKNQMRLKAILEKMGQ